MVGSGLDAIGEKAKSAMSKLTSAFDNTASKAQAAGKKVGTGFTNGMQSGLSSAPDKAKSVTSKIESTFTKTAAKAKSEGQNVGTGFTNGMKSGLSTANSVASTATAQVTSTLRSGRNGAYSAGAYISQGFAAGMLSCLGTIQSAAAQMAAAADAAIRAKAKIHSPSKVTTKLGEYFGEGFVNGIADMARAAWNAAADLVSIPAVATPDLAFAGAYGGELSAEYDYTRKAEYNITVVSEIDGRECARATSTYMQDELDRKQTRDERKHGRV